MNSEVFSLPTESQPNFSLEEVSRVRDLFSLFIEIERDQKVKERNHHVDHSIWKESQPRQGNRHHY